MTYAFAFCGEENDTFVDPGSGARQVYTEDCAVCCRPNLITVTLDADGDAQLEVTQGVRGVRRGGRSFPIPRTR
jgi:Cysteine-rich CPXCG